MRKLHVVCDTYRKENNAMAKVVKAIELGTLRSLPTFIFLVSAMGIGLRRGWTLHQ
jgi:hypothetical protein